MDNASGAAVGGTDLRKARRQKAANQPSVDRLPPHSPENEMGVLSCILISPKCMNECVTRFKEAGDVFYDLRHQTIYNEMVAMEEERAIIEVITVQQRLKDKQLLEQVGGITYLSQLADYVPSAWNLPSYIDVVLEKYLLRKMIATCTDLVGRVYDHEGDVDVLMDEFERDALAIRPKQTGDDKPIKELVCVAIQRIEEAFNRKGVIQGIPTGFVDLDKMTNGMHAGNMIVVAARPSMGKTSLCMNIAEHVVLNEKLPVGVFSLEMTAEELTLRTICSCARVNLRDINEGFMNESMFPKLTSAAGKISNSKLYLCDISGLSILQLRARARRMVQMFGIKLLIIDYLQLIHAATKRGRDNRQQEVSDVSSGIKELAKELRIPILVACQLNRDLEKDKKRKPRLSDLRESGSIEQDADLVGMLYRPDRSEDEEDQDEKEAYPVNLLIAKARNGPTGIVSLTFFKSHTRFESAARIPVDEEDVPADR